MNNIFIDPIAEFGSSLLDIDKPSRYTGGEYGILADKTSAFHTLIAFPDLYEIGMSNHALRIIYNRLNEIEGIFCDRAFAPAPDFEKLLREKKIPLYGLDTGIKFSCLDLLLFTIGYEPGLTAILTMFDVSGIPLRCIDRTDEHPITIAGGPAVSNPLPYAAFIDAFWIGEAEAGFFELVKDLAAMKREGAGRAEQLKKISLHPNIFVKGKEKTIRAVYSGFDCDVSDTPVFPVPSMKTVQHHGMAEIMRGCPNGCRFCHAGFWYRPMRQKKIELVIKSVNDLVIKGGWQEISLSSLSSGDYNGIDELLETLNKMYIDKHISFQLPSLKVSSFALDLLEKISVTRKSSLTFAVETPNDAWQASINKDVTKNSVIEILGTAKKYGWKKVKFYFMIGLPVPDLQGAPSPQITNSEIYNSQEIICEEEEIVKFITEVGKKTKMHFNINVGIFIPKPHTPFQWASLINTNEAVRKMDFIKTRLKPFGHKVSTSDPLLSLIESLLSRGDERAGFLCEQAFFAGSRLDPWNEYINRERWLQLIKDNYEIIDSFHGEKPEQEFISWHGIESCVNDEYFQNELANSKTCKYTQSCIEKCNLCGVCNSIDELHLSTNNKNTSNYVNHINDTVNINTNKSDSSAQSNLSNPSNISIPSNSSNPSNPSDPAIYRVLFAFSKHGSAVFHGHLSIIEIFSMSFMRAQIPVMYTKGFSPLAKIEIASPLSTGVSADFEIASADFYEKINTDKFIAGLNVSLPQGFRIEKAECFYIPSGGKKHSLSSLLWGFAYSKDGSEINYIPAKDEKKYRECAAISSSLSSGNQSRASLFFFNRKETLAKNITDKSTEWQSYFDVYRYLYRLTY